MSRILYITPFFNFPPRDGASIRSIKLFEAMYDDYEIDVITYRNGSINMEALKSFSKSKFYFFSSSYQTSKKSSYLGRLFSKTLPGFSSHDPIAIAQEIEKVLIKNRNYKILYFATQLMGQARLYLKSNIHSILDLYDIYSTYSKSKLKKVNILRPYFLIFFLEAIRVKRFEKRIIKNFETILVTCEENFESIPNLDSNSNIIQISNGTLFPKNPNICKGESVLMVANFEYSGNYEGIQWFIHHVWPIFKSRNDSDLVLVGKFPKKLEKLVEGDSRIKLTGLVPLLEPYYKRAICAITPLFNDGGTKTKLIEALAYGVPIISTPIGAKGFEFMTTIKITEEPNLFSDYIHSLFECEYPFDELKKNQNFIKNKFTWKKIGQDLNSAISKRITGKKYSPLND